MHELGHLRRLPHAIGVTSPPPIFVDGLQVARWSRDVFRSQQRAGLTAVNCTCCVWEGFVGAMENLAQFKRWFVEYDDLICQVRTAGDIAAARDDGRVGIILSWQNISGIEDRLDRLELFWDIGLRIIQIAYNTQNLVGAGCYEANDPGLSGFGREVLAEMNRLGILVDLSHVGAGTTRDVIRYSTQPVVFSHVCPAALKPHPRNKTDQEMRMVAELGGVVGITGFPWFLSTAGPTATIDDVLNAVEYTINLVGEDSVAIGTDFIDGYGAPFLEWILRDKGYARPLLPTPLERIVAEFRMPEGLATIDDFPNLVATMRRRGWNDKAVRKVIGENWLRVFRSVWRS